MGLSKVERNEVHQGSEGPGHDSSENQNVGKVVFDVGLTGPLEGLKGLDDASNVVFPLLYR